MFQNIRKAAELAIKEPLEMIISNSPFHVATHHDGDCTCAFKADQYYIKTWSTPGGNYSIGDDHFADNGHTSFVGCAGNNTSLEGKSA